MESVRPKQLEPNGKVLQAELPSPRHIGHNASPLIALTGLFDCLTGDRSATATTTQRRSKLPHFFRHCTGYPESQTLPSLALNAATPLGIMGAGGPGEASVDGCGLSLGSGGRESGGGSTAPTLPSYVPASAASASSLNKFTEASTPCCHRM